MSSSIAIPAAPKSSVMDFDHTQPGKRAPSSSSSYASSPEPSSSKSSPASAQEQKMVHQRRPSLLSTAISKQECTTINVADDPEDPPRLITYLSSSQGFAWNPEIFLPSYVDYDYVPLENRCEPVHEIVLSDEDIKNILP